MEDICITFKMGKTIKEVDVRYENIKNKYFPFSYKDKMFEWSKAPNSSFYSFERACVQIPLLTNFVASLLEFS